MKRVLITGTNSFIGKNLVEYLEKYMSKKKLFAYKLILAVTLAPIRTHMAESQRFAGMYQSMKKVLYKGRRE